jgi:fido (protein-threonine AMPylation protein)
MVKRNTKKVKLKKGLVNTNRVFGGRLVNKGDFDFEIDMASRQKKPFRKISHITRAMVSAHSFSDGNKRTAITAVASGLRDAGFKADRKKLVKAMIRMSKDGEGNLTKIEKRLRRCTKK